ncbi:hypothetical protein BDN72DRAFT_960382 [Pluteus cervinus]|uniref:Uncharacterized protein n=1 Tax=Pluteus cervinus TaxID=181527 RepID=A0ACD3AQK1_9AGAR|nr:hypothetical protein BDN72DRAFT_960382 [Pluteus cervinus]
MRHYLPTSPRHAIDALGAFDGTRLIPTMAWMNELLVVPQEWELEPDPIELPVSTSKNALDAWMRTNAQNLSTVLYSEGITGDVDLARERPKLTIIVVDQSRGPYPDISSPVNDSDPPPELQLKLDTQTTRAGLMFNIAITSMELWQSSHGDRFEYVLVHLSWYPQGRHRATSDGNTPAHFSTKILLKRNPGVPGPYSWVVGPGAYIVPYFPREGDPQGAHVVPVDLEERLTPTADYYTSTVEGELGGICLVQLRFLGSFLPSLIDLVSVVRVLHSTTTYAYNLLKYPAFWYADTIMALMAALEGVESETQVVEGKERVYKDLQRGLRKDLRTNGFENGGVDWAGWLRWMNLGFWISSDSRSMYPKGFPLPVDERTDATALKEAKKEAEQQAGLICSKLKQSIDMRTQVRRDERRQFEQTARTIHEEIIHRDISLALERGQLGMSASSD